MSGRRARARRKTMMAGGLIALAIPGAAPAATEVAGVGGLLVTTRGTVFQLAFKGGPMSCQPTHCNSNNAGVLSVNGTPYTIDCAVNDEDGGTFYGSGRKTGGDETAFFKITGIIKLDSLSAGNPPVALPGAGARSETNSDGSFCGAGGISTDPAVGATFIKYLKA